MSKINFVCLTLILQTGENRLIREELRRETLLLCMYLYTNIYVCIYVYIYILYLDIHRNIFSFSVESETLSVIIPSNECDAFFVW